MGKLFSQLTRMLVVPGIADTQCGFKAYRKEAAKKLAELQKMDGYTFDVEHLLLARQTIDTLEMLHEKTRGNLDAEESKLFEGLLYELRMHFVEKVK